MNPPTWPHGFPAYYSPATPIYQYPYSNVLSPYHQTTLTNSLNTSSGYESASRETSLIDPSFSSPTAEVKNFSVSTYHDSAIDEDYDEQSSESLCLANGRKKRRVLSRPQRQEANRRERERMEIINDAYERLRNALPFKKGRKRQKMSRMDTVDGAIRYIHSLLEMLHGPNYTTDWAMF